MLAAGVVPIPSESACTTTLYKGYSTTAEALITTLSLRQRAKTAVLDQMFVPSTKESILDSGAMAPIIEGTQDTGARVRLVGVTGAGVDAELADLIFPVRTATDELYAIDTTGSQAGSTLLVERTKDTILSLPVLLKAKFKVDFALGTEEDPSFEGTLRTPEGHIINLMFRDNLWFVPL